MTLSKQSLAYYYCTGAIEKSTKEKGQIPYMDAILRVAPDMFRVIEMLVNILNENQLNEINNFFQSNSLSPNNIEGFDNDAVFLEKIYEICFGDDAINRGFTRTDVIDQLKELSDNYPENYQEGEDK